MKHFKLTTLVDNAVYGHVIQAEHGLSIYIESDNHNILFDTGQSDLFIRNAETLGIDLRKVDALVLSHGHYDHTGGLRHFLALNRKAKVYCKREAMNRKFKVHAENGIRQAEELDLSRFCWTDTTTEIFPHIVICPRLPIVNGKDTHFNNFFTQPIALPGENFQPAGEYIPDTFEDEQVLVLLTENTYSVISACSHRGITNILQAVAAEFPQRSLKLLIGGFHIHNAGEVKYQLIADYLKSHTPEMFGVGHCTGIDQFARFSKDFGDKVFYNHAGKVVEI